MSLDSYKIFETIARKHSLVRAAEELNLTPSAVSHSLMKLEGKFGFTLVVRDRTGCELTRNGELLLPSIQSILLLEKKMWEEIHFLNGLEKGVIHLGTFNSACCYWLPDILKRFKQKYPGINVHIFQGGYADIENWLHSSKIDLGFLSLPVPANFSVTPLITDRLLCNTPASFRSCNPGRVTIEEIVHQQFIFPEEGYDNDIKSFIRDNNLSISQQHKIRDDSSIVALVESGLGIAIVSELLLKKVKGNINIYTIETDPARTIGIATKHKEFLTPATKALVQEITSYIKQSGS